MSEERSTLESQATLYLLDGLNAAERRDFEARLAVSPELRGYLRELEEGAVALSLAQPQRSAPATAWRQIEQTIATEQKASQSEIPLIAFLRSGWAAAAACLVGWLCYALWNGGPGSDPSPSVTASGTELHIEGLSAVAIPAQSDRMFPMPPTFSDRTVPGSASPDPLAGLTEVTALRQQIAAMEMRVSQLSNQVTAATRSSAGRLSFYPLTPSGESGTSGVQVASPSPELQQALLLALARSLGWWAPTNSSEAQPGGGTVRFIEVPPHGETQGGAVETQVSVGPPPANAADLSASSSGHPSDAVALAYAGYVWLAYNPRSLPVGTAEVVVWSGNGAYATVPVGDTTTVIGLSSAGQSGGPISFYASNGGTVPSYSFLGQVPDPASAP